MSINNTYKYTHKEKNRHDVRGQENIFIKTRAWRGFFDLWIHVLVPSKGQEHVSIAENGQEHISIAARSGEWFIGDMLMFSKGLGRILTNSENSEVYEYDPRGNRSVLMTDEAPELTTATYSYNEWDQLTEATNEAGENVTYNYDGDGLLVGRTKDGVTRRYYYDGAQIIAEAKVVGETTQLVASFIRGNQLEAIQYANGSKAYPLYNGHGDIVELRSETCEVLNRYTYDMWGNITSKEEKVYNPFRYSEYSNALKTKTTREIHGIYDEGDRS